MELIPEVLHNYAESISSPEDELLREVNEFTYQQHSHPHMLSGHLQGKVLEMLSFMLQPKRVLEIGTFTGYSALCLAKGLAKDGLLHTIDIREEDVAKARSFFDKSTYQNQIISHAGNALEIIPQLDEQWDLVFIDADKTAYTQYLEMILPRLSDRGFILADNIFFHGQVLEETVSGKNAKAIHAFNNFVKEQENLEKVALTIRDGLFLIRKK